MSVKNIYHGGAMPVWADVDAYTISHLHPNTKPHAQDLVQILEHSRDNDLPGIAAQPALAKFLAMQCKFGNVKHALEVGTLGGYTATWIATQNPDIRITTLEIDPHHANIARENLERAGVADRVEVLVGPALDILPTLKKEIEDGTRQKFGFTFIDADKINNLKYFQFAVDMSYSRACIVVDNIVRFGKLITELESPQVQGAREVIEAAGKDERIEGCVIQTVSEKSYDGFLMAVVA